LFFFFFFFFFFFVNKNDNWLFIQRIMVQVLFW